MKTVSMLEFRRDAETVIRKVQQGKGMVLTYRGKPALKLEPLEPVEKNGKKSLDTFLDLAKLWDSKADSTPLNHNDIDRIVYGV